MVVRFQIVFLTILNHITSIGTNCFRECFFLKDITLPNGLTNISTRCFEKCTALTRIVFPPSIQRLEDKCFVDCRSLRTLTIPDGVTSIGNGCFQYCSWVQSISIPSAVQTIGKDCFHYCKSLKKLALPLNENNKYPFKVSYTDYLILKRCGIDCEKVVFYSNDLYNHDVPTNIPIILNISNVMNKTKYDILPNSVVSLKRGYFLKSLTSVTIPSSLTYLCDYCFNNYSILKSITLPTTVKYIGKHLIDGCSSLTELKYEGDWNNIIVSYDDHLKFKSKGLIFNNIEYSSDDKKKYGNVIPSIVHSLHHSYYNRLTHNINIPTHITALDNHMFDMIWGYGYSFKMYFKLQKITIPTSIQTIPKYCFSQCRLLTKVELPSTLTTIKKKAFSKCISLQSIIIPSSVTLIEQYAFENCHLLTINTLPNSSITLEKGCFKGCYQLKRCLHVSPDCF
ncbi:hypothetical protein QTN25_004926 [Entamoeba marina]